MREMYGKQVALQAHRGVSTDCPENTMAAFLAAAAQGYDIIELDPKFTKDNVCVVLHDRTLARTGRNADGTKIEGEIKIAEITVAQARGYEYGSWHAAEYAGEMIPTMEEALRFAAAQKIPLKIDNVLESFTDEQLEILMDLVEKTGMEELAGFTCTKMEVIEKIVARFANCPIHYDGLVNAEILEKVCGVLRENPLVVWLPYPTPLNEWCKLPSVSDELVALVRAQGAKLGLWILEDEEHFADACKRFAPDYVETTGKIKP